MIGDENCICSKMKQLIEENHMLKNEICRLVPQISTTRDRHQRVNPQKEIERDLADMRSMYIAASKERDLLQLKIDDAEVAIESLLSAVARVNGPVWGVALANLSIRLRHPLNDQ